MLFSSPKKNVLTLKLPILLFRQNMWQLAFFHPRFECLVWLVVRPLSPSSL